MIPFRPLRSVPVCLSLALLACAPAASAQGSAIPPVPGVTPLQLAELALGEEALDFLPGALPEGLELPLPDGARLYGSIVGESGTSVLVDTAIFGDHRAARRAVADALLAAGWQEVDPFVPNPVVFEVDSMRDDEPPQLLCAPDRARQLFADVDVRADVGAMVRLELRPFCEVDPQEPAAPSPTLRLPDGVDVFGSNSGWGGDAFEAAVRYRTALEPQAIYDTLAEQLGTQGWTVSDLQEISGVLSARVRYEDPEEGLWLGLLSVSERSSAFQVDRLR